MSFNPKKVSELNRISYSVVDSNDLHYFVKSYSNGFFESYHIEFSDIFLATNILDTAKFCNNTLLISNNNITINGDIMVSNNLYVSENITASANAVVNTSNSNILNCNYLYSRDYTSLSNGILTCFSSNVSIANTLFIDSQNYRIANNTIISCGVNRVRDVSDPVENLDALNLQYFNNNSFKMTGAIVNFPSTSEPQGWLRANGQIIDRSTFSDLWQFANTSGYLSDSEVEKTDSQFGPGDGSSTFSLPNLNCCSIASTSMGSSTNIIIMLDVSGSMNDKIELAKNAIISLVYEYYNRGDVRVLLITFSSEVVNTYSWITASLIQSKLDLISVTGKTNYDAPITETISKFSDSGKLELDNTLNVSYFLSDGDPTSPSGSLGIGSSEETTWINFLNTNSIKSYALGMGGDATLYFLNPIAYDGTTSTNMNAGIVDDMGDLQGVLLETVDTTTEITPLNTFIKY